jgi:AcrR family transcriptional regulator
MKRSSKGHKGMPGRRPKMGREEGDTRAAILTAARRMFAERGLDGTSVREVAKAANVNNAMIYYHFKDKDDLYQSVLSNSFSALTAIWDNEIFKSSASVRQKIQRYIEGAIRFHQNNEDLRRIMAMEFAASGGTSTWMCEKYFADNYNRLTEILKEGMRRGELKKFDPSHAVASLIGVIFHNFILQHMAEHINGKGVNLSPKRFGAFVTELFFNGLAFKA